MASKLFNFKQTLQDLNIGHLKDNPQTRSSSFLAYNYSPAGHVITGHVNLVNNEDLRSLIMKGPQFRESKSFTWRRNLSILWILFEDYAERWATSEKEDLDSLLESISY